MAEIEPLAHWCVMQVVTIAKFRRPSNPTRCDVHRYHVWRWRGRAQAPAGLTCQCGALTDPPRADLRSRLAG